MNESPELTSQPAKIPSAMAWAADSAGRSSPPRALVVFVVIGLISWAAIAGIRSRLSAAMGLGWRLLGDRDRGRPASLAAGWGELSQGLPPCRWRDVSAGDDAMGPRRDRLWGVVRHARSVACGGLRRAARRRGPSAGMARGWGFRLQRTWSVAPVPSRFCFSKLAFEALNQENVFENGYRESRSRGIAGSRRKDSRALDYVRLREW